MTIHVAMNMPMKSSVTELLPGRGKAAPYSAVAETSSPSTAQAPAQNGSADDTRVPPVEPKELQKAVSQLTDTMRNLKRSLEFSIDEASGRTVVTVIDRETNEVIRQIPEKELLALSNRLEKAAGVFVHEEA